MIDDVHEPLFAVLLVLAAGLALVTYMLGVLIEPIIASVLSGVLVVLGATVLLPEGQRMIGAVMGLIAVSLAGVAVPRLVAGVPAIRNEMVVTLTLSGLVLFSTIALFRMTVFSRRTTRAA